MSSEVVAVAVAVITAVAEFCRCWLPLNVYYSDYCMLCHLQKTTIFMFDMSSLQISKLNSQGKQDMTMIPVAFTTRPWWIQHKKKVYCSRTWRCLIWCLKINIYMSSVQDMFQQIFPLHDRPCHDRPTLGEQGNTGPTGRHVAATVPAVAPTHKNGGLLVRH